MKIEGIDDRQDSIIDDGAGVNIDTTICISAASALAGLKKCRNNDERYYYLIV